MLGKRAGLLPANAMPLILNIIFYGCLMLLPLFLFFLSYYKNLHVAKKATAEGTR